jgi:hypothetical protein
MGSAQNVLASGKGCFMERQGALDVPIRPNADREVVQ